MEILDIQGLFLYVYIIPNYAYFYKGIHTLPSSNINFNTTTNLRVYNGSYAAGNVSSHGSYYNARTANTIKANETITQKDYVNNICPKNWTLPNVSQHKSSVKYITAIATINSGAYDSAWGWKSCNYWWGRSGYDNTYFYRMAGAAGNTTGEDFGRDGAIYGESIRCLQK